MHPTLQATVYQVIMITTVKKPTAAYYPTGRCPRICAFLQHDTQQHGTFQKKLITGLRLFAKLHLIHPVKTA